MTHMASVKSNQSIKTAVSKKSALSGGDFRDDGSDEVPDLPATRRTTNQNIEEKRRVSVSQLETMMAAPRPPPRLLRENRRDQAAAAKAAQRTMAQNALRGKLVKGLITARGCKGLTVSFEGVDQISDQEDEENEKDDGSLGRGSVFRSEASEVSIMQTRGPGRAVLSHLKLKTDKETRLQRVGKLSNEHWSARSTMPSLNISNRERERYEQVWKRYDYNKSGGLDLAECHDALADLGLKPSSRKDKLYIKTRIDLEGGELDFPKFCKLVTERQSQFHESERQYLQDLFKQYDGDRSGSLSAEELVKVFADLHVSPERDDERIAFLDAVVESDVDGSGEIEWEEFEILVQAVRSKISQCRREREVRIAQQMRLPTHVFLNFRHMLVSLHDSFRSLDESNEGAVSAEAVPDVMFELGFDKSLKRIQELCSKDEEILRLMGSGKVDFAILLQIAQRFRNLKDGHMTEDLQYIFNMYDLDHSGTISDDELLWLMRDLNLDTWKDSKDVMKLLDTFDLDGNGVIDFEEFKHLFNYVSELQDRAQREDERSCTEALGYSAEEVRELREVFVFLGGEESTSLTLPVVAQAFETMGFPLKSLEELHEYDVEKLGRLDFTGFIKVVKEKMPKQNRRNSLRRLSAGGLNPGLNPELIAAAATVAFASVNSSQSEKVDQWTSECS